MAIRALRTAKEATTSPDAPVGDIEAGLDDGALVGGRIRELRKAEGLSLCDVATTVGISVSYLSQIERGISRLTIGMLKRIADALGVHLNWFFHGGTAGSADERDIPVRRPTSTDPHLCANAGRAPVKVLWVITPPHY